MRAKREGTGLDSGRKYDGDDGAHRLSVRRTSTNSSLLSDNSHSEPLSSSSPSEPSRQSALPGFGHSRNISGGGDQPTCFPAADSHCDFHDDGQFTKKEHSHPVLLELRSRGTWEQGSVGHGREAVDTAELDAIFQGAPGCGLPQRSASKGNENNVHVRPQESPAWSELSYGSDKKNTTALNAVRAMNNVHCLIKALYALQTHGCGCCQILVISLSLFL